MWLNGNEKSIEDTVRLQSSVSLIKFDFNTLCKFFSFCSMPL